MLVLVMMILVRCSRAVVCMARSLRLLGLVVIKVIGLPPCSACAASMRALLRRREGTASGA